MSKAPFVLREELAAIAIAYRNERYIASDVLPYQTVGRQEFKYLVYNKDERYTIPDFVGLAPGFVSLNQINFTLSCLLSRTREPEIIFESFLGGRTSSYRIPMSEAARAAWRGRDCR